METPRISYNTQYICQYMAPDLFAQSELIEEEEKEFIRETLYREDILNVFQVKDDFDEIMSGPVIPQLTERLKEHSVMRECMTQAGGFYALTCSEQAGLECGLCMLFSYSYFDATHLCICDFLETGQIREENINALKERLKQQNSVQE